MVKRMVCPKCGMQGKPNDRFCGKCGILLVEKEVEDTNQSTENMNSRANAKASEDNSSKTITKTTSKGNSSKTITKGDIYEAIAEAMEFDISDDAIAFINDNPQFFPCNISNMVAASAYVDFNLDYAHVAKNPFKYSDRFMCEPGEVIDCQEIEENGNALTYLQIEDDFGYNYCVYYLGELPDVFEGSHVTAEFLPFDVITFENMGGYYTEAIVGAACYVE